MDGMFTPMPGSLSSESSVCNAPGLVIQGLFVGRLEIPFNFSQLVPGNKSLPLVLIKFEP